MTKKTFDSSKFLQNAVFLLHEIQKQASDLKDETNDEIGKLVKKFKGSCEDLGSMVSVLSNEAKKQVPKRWATEVDRFLDRVGLERKDKKPVAVKTAAPKKTVKKAVKKTSPKKTPKATAPGAQL